MLSNDVAVDVISFLDRIDLDTAEITSRGFNRIVHVYFEDFPRRNITRFILCSGEIIAFHSENGDQIATILPNLEDNLRRLTVREVHFECPLDEVLFNALLPHVARFSESVCFAPTQYSHVDLVERAFAELFFCRVLRISALSVYGLDDHWAYSKEAPFVSLPCILACELLYVGNTFIAKGEFSTKLSRWLNAGGPKKELTLESKWWPSPLNLRLTVCKLLQAFAIATVPSEFKLTLIAPSCTTAPERQVNGRTHEELVYKFEPCGKLVKNIFIRKLITG